MRRCYAIARFFCAFIVLTALIAAPITAKAQVDINITLAPPELPIYEQPPLPAPGYIWAPGYWAWGPDGYYWVPGTWVLPPAVGLLWTPGYWGWRDGIYVWNVGYWGPHVGFYGGVNYGFGYGGEGYGGGRWNNGVFAYNRTVNNFGGVHITNVYNETVVVNNNARTSFNGGSGGLTAQPTAEQQAFAHEQHTPPTAIQTQHQQTASTNRGLLASENHGQPSIAATSKPNQFSGKGVMAARSVSGGTGGGVSGGVTGGKPANFNANRAPGTNTPNALQKKGPGGNPAALSSTGTHMNTEHKTMGGTTGGSPPPPHPQTPHPHVVSAPKPPPPHPPAPHPQAHQAPHPNNQKKHG